MSSITPTRYLSLSRSFLLHLQLLTQSLSVPLPNLRALEVDGSSVSASQLRKIFIKSWKERASEIRKVSYLRSVAAFDSAFVCQVMRIFCPNLKAAYLRSEELPYLLMPLDKCDFESMKQERINRLKNNLEQFEIDPMVAYPKLKFVELKCTRSSPSFGIREFLSRCPNMKGLMISDAPALHDYGLHHFNYLRAMFIFGGKCFRLFPYSLAEHLRPNERVDCFHSLKVLDINGTQIPVSLLPTLGHLHSLHRLSISALKFQLPPDVNSEERIAENMGPILEDLISGLSELRSLLLSNIAWQHPFEFSIFHEKLRRLELAEVQGGFCSSPFKMTVKEIRCPRLRSCKLQLDVMHPAEFAALMEQVRIGSPWLTNVQGAVLQTTLHISNSSQPIPASLHPTVWRAPLAKISLQKCRSLDREGMETLFAALPRLETFTIEKCKGLGTLNGCRSRSLQWLRIIGGNGLHGEMDFSGFPNLHEVDLQLGGKITSVNLVDLPLLAVITIKRTPPTSNLQRVIIKGVPMLCKLHFEWFCHVPIICIDAGERLFQFKRNLIFSADSFVIRAPSLERCVLEARLWKNKEKDLSDIVAGCPNLNTLEINRVRGLSVEFLQQLADSARSAFEEVRYEEADSDKLAAGFSHFFGNTRRSRIIPTRLQETNAIAED